MTLIFLIAKKDQKPQDGEQWLKVPKIHQLLVKAVLPNYNQIIFVRFGEIVN